MSEIADLLERFRRGADLVATVTTGAAGTELDFQPGAGKWSVRQIACHLADIEVISAMRLRMVIAEDNPSMQAIDQNAWATKLDYSTRKISQAIETLRRMRAENYELLKLQPEEVFKRTGTHSKRGVVSVLDMVKFMSEHTENHVRQIQAARAAYKEHKVKLQAAAQQ
jgi:hypothetical protein